MRLTLRTLLAYLNDVLEPAEAEPLKQRIEESEFASTLVQRIRHVLRRLRLSAPKVDGRGLGFDANSVAEYLDSTMAPERVADFEKVCLESDVHLAEVAAGYEILAKVLSEHANVPESLRTRVYALRDTVKPAPAPTPAHAVDNGQQLEKEQTVNKSDAAQPPEPPPAPEVVRIKPEVPDYLKPDRKPSRSAWPLVPLALLVIAGIAFCVPPLSQYNPLLQTSPEITQHPEIDTKPIEVSPSPPVDKTAADENDKGEVDSGDTTSADKGAGDNAATMPADPDTVAVGPALPTEDAEADKDSDTKPVEEEDKKPVDPDEAVAKNDLRPVPAEGSAEKPVAKPASIEPSSVGAQLGRFISDETVLASYNSSMKAWLRVPPRSLILEGQQFVSLPLYRTQIALASGSQLTLVGEASVAFARDKDTELPLVELNYGRLLLQSNALQNVQTNLSLNGLRGTLALDTADSVAAIEVYSYLPPGSDPLAKDPPNLTIANIIGVTGSCTWEEQGAAGVSIQANSVHILINGEESRKRTRVQLPSWIDAASTDKLEREAAKMIEPLVLLDRPLETALQEQAKVHRRFEVRFQIARCLAYLGHFEALVKQLADDKYHSFWMKPDGHVETLRKQLARSSGVAEQVRAGLIEARGEKDGGLLFRLLQGFNNEQLIKGDAKLIAGGYDEQLVICLAHPSMDAGVLAFDNLVRITGGTRNLYDPSASPEKSKSRIKAWQDDLDKGRIRYAADPSPLTEFKSLEIKTEEAEGKGR